jgi:hypothetical protein
LDRRRPPRRLRSSRTLSRSCRQCTTRTKRGSASTCRRRSRCRLIDRDLALVRAVREFMTGLLGDHSGGWWRCLIEPPRPMFLEDDSADPGGQPQATMPTFLMRMSQHDNALGRSRALKPARRASHYWPPGPRPTGFALPGGRWSRRGRGCRRPRSARFCLAR